MADAVSGEALDRAQKIWNEMRDEPDSTGKIAVLAEALEKTEAAAEAAAVRPGPGSVRVLRVLEYVYPDAKAMTEDMSRWQVQGTYSPRRGFYVRSTVLPLEVLR